LSTFCEFGRLGTLSAAADALGYTPGAVSQHVAALERAVDAKLVERVGRHLVLTDAGHLLARYADSLLATEREARQAVAALRGRVAGPLTVGTWGSTAAALLAPVVRRMSARYPDVVVRSKEVDLDSAAATVRRGSVDVAFGLDYADAPLPRHQGIAILELHEEEFVVAVAAEPGAEARAYAVLEDLAGLPWILPPASSHYGTAIRAGFRRCGFEPEVVHEVTDTAASLQLAASGLGATVMTGLMRRLNPNLELRQLAMRDPLTRRIVLLTPADRPPRPVAAFTEVATAVVASLLASGDRAVVDDDDGS
jgi:DNA-binding transcriptional LysR family regulator